MPFFVLKENSHAKKHVLFFSFFLSWNDVFIRKRMEDRIPIFAHLPMANIKGKTF